MTADNNKDNNYTHRKAAIWKVTGYGPVSNSRGGRLYGERDGFKTVDVEADTKEEALALALTILPADMQEQLKVIKFATLSR